MKKIVFEGKEDFEAFRAAEKWCKENGYSVGSMQREDPIGIHKGDWDIPKWRHLDEEDRAGLDGIITGNKRRGPVVIELRKAA